ncbi:hypothetical protein D6827_02145, partial [Candidatus Parcubacteria bacterium]
MYIPERLKFILKLLLLLFAAALIGWLIYTLFIKKPLVINEKTGTQTTTETTTSGGNLSPAATKTTPQTSDKTQEEKQSASNTAKGGETYTQRLTASAIKSPQLLNGNAIIYYDPTDGR